MILCLSRNLSLRGVNTKSVKVIYIIVTIIYLFILIPIYRTHISNKTRHSSKLSNNRSSCRGKCYGFQSDHFKIHNEIGEYTDYTIKRLKLKPIQSITPLNPAVKEPVINDVLSFNYPIDMDPRHKLNKCQHWSNESTQSSVLFNRTLLIVVISAIGHSEKRQLIRKTWANANLLEAEWIQVIFLIGASKDEDRLIDGQLRRESEKYGDLVQANVIDTYGNLTLKSVAMLHWAYTHCPGAQLVLKCDDDNYINFKVLNEILPAVNGTKQIFGAPVPILQPERYKSELL